MDFFPDSWTEVFAFEKPLLELVVRGTSLYLLILAFLRVLPRRTGTELSNSDLVFVLIVAESAAQALGNYNSVGDGAVVVTTIMGWNYLLNFLSYHFSFVERLTSAPPTTLIKNGRLNRRAMRQELLTEDELMESLRKQGVEDLKEIKIARVEAEGRITVIKNKKD